MPLPLEGVRVLELSSGVAAGLAGRFLRGYGASVRHVAIHTSVALAVDEIAYLHAGKTAVPWQHDVANLDELVRNADIVLCDLQPRQLTQLSIDWNQVRDRNPSLVVVSVTPFGLTGPYADYQATSAVSFAMGGIMSLTGDAEREPLLTGGGQAAKLAGLNAFAVAVTCWFGRVRHGAGELVDLSAQECAAGMLELYRPSTAVGGPTIPRLGNHTRAPWAVYPCLDGWAGAFALERQVPALFALLNDAELGEERFTNPLQRVEPLNEEALTAKLYVWFIDKTRAEALQAGLDARVPIGISLTPAELLQSKGLVARGAFESLGGGVTVPGRPFPGFGWRPSIESSHDEWTQRPPSTMHGERGQLPLAGLRVIDLTMMWAGPFATMHLAAMGAEVIKVESPSAWDNIRTLVVQPGVADPWNSSYYFAAYNRDKKSLTLDLSQPEGRELLLRLVKDADVLIENYRADVLDRLGLTDDVLKQANPNLVTVSMAAFGKEGPDRSYVGFGPVIELMSGLTSLSGYLGDEEPFKTGVSYGDPVAGLAAVAAIGLGLLQRDAVVAGGGNDAGCHIDLAQREASMALIGEAFVAASRGEDPKHFGCRDERFAPQNVYRTMGDDQWIVISVRTDEEWRLVCGLLGRVDLERLSVADRHVRHDELDTILGDWLGSQQPQQAMEQLQLLGVPAGRVLDTSSVHDDPQLLYRDFWVYLPHPKIVDHKQQAVTWRLVDASPVPRRHMPMFGEHNAEILGSLGLTESDMADLRARAVIADAPINPGVG